MEWTRLVEDYPQSEPISAKGTWDRSVCKRDITILHSLRRRRGLVACRGVVFGTIEASDQCVKDVELKNARGAAAKGSRMVAGAKNGLNSPRAREFRGALCESRSEPPAIREPGKNVLAPHPKHGPGRGWVSTVDNGAQLEAGHKP